MLFLLTAISQSPAVVDQVSPQQTATQRAGEPPLNSATVVIAPVSPSRVSTAKTDEDQTLSQEGKLVAACRTAQLRQQAAPEGCERVSSPSPSQTANVEGTLLESLGLNSSSSSGRLVQRTDLRNADALAADAGAAGGIRSTDAAAVVASQQAAVLPPAGSR